jgi:curli production assembly/transport component CsgF
MYKKLTLAALIIGCPLSYAGELVHEFVNPDFGGSAFNGAPLLANASAQNSFQPKSTGTTGYVAPVPKTAAETFQANLNSQILNKLSQVILNKAFPGTGTNQTLPVGTSTMGNYTINNDTANNSITVTDSTTGTVLVTLDLNTLQ